MADEGLSFGLLKSDTKVTAAGYSTSGTTGQTEVMAAITAENSGAYTTIYTVTTGKTLYVTAILISTTNNAYDFIKLATGAAAAETDIFLCEIMEQTPHNIVLNTPIRFTSGTRISGYSGQNGMNVCIIGWEE